MQKQGLKWKAVIGHARARVRQWSSPPEEGNSIVPRRPRVNPSGLLYLHLFTAAEKGRRRRFRRVSIFGEVREDPLSSLRGPRLRREKLVLRLFLNMVWVVVLWSFAAGEMLFFFHLIHILSAFFFRLSHSCGNLTNWNKLVVIHFRHSNIALQLVMKPKNSPLWHTYYRRCHSWLCRCIFE